MSPSAGAIEPAIEFAEHLGVQQRAFAELAALVGLEWTCSRNISIDDLKPHEVARLIAAFHGNTKALAPARLALAAG